mmetsp:Transcript_1804/g.3913  ORF Transcript_1804/g.3913 Transcript_1804/m.3913 type:complete len:85 (-) Transcript_1804:32-286(-)
MSRSFAGDAFECIRRNSAVVMLGLFDSKVICRQDEEKVCPAYDGFASTPDFRRKLPRFSMLNDHDYLILETAAYYRNYLSLPQK